MNIYSDATGSIDFLEVNGSGLVYVDSTKAEIGSIINNKNSTTAGIVVENGAVLKCGNLTNNGRIVLRNGTINSTGTVVSQGSSGRYDADSTSSTICRSFESPAIADADSHNEGSVTATSVKWQNGFTNTGTITATGSLTFGDGSYTVGGTFVCDTDVTVTKPNEVSFSLKVDNVTKTISGAAFESVEAGTLVPEAEVAVVMKDKSGNTIANNANIYLGTDVNVSATVTANGAAVSNPNVSFEIYNGSSWVAWTPTTTGTTSLTYSIGTKKIRAKVAAKDGAYRAGESTVAQVNVNYLPITEVPKTGNNYVAINGTKGNGNWYISNLTFSAPSGFLIKTNDVGDTFGAVTKEFTEKEYNDADYGFYLVRSSDGALTNQVTRATLIPDLASAGFDLVNPAFLNAEIDGENRELIDGEQIVGRTVVLSVYDKNLSSVTVDGTVYNTSSFKNVDGGFKFTKEFNAVPGTKTHTIYAEDASGRNSSISFDLTYAKDVATATVSMPDVIYGVEYPLPTVTTDSDQDEDNYEYYYKKTDDDDEAYSSEKPTEVGSYNVKVVIPFTDKCTAVSDESSFDISYLSVPSPAYTVSGTLGKNSYYTTNVTINAPEGYQITDEAGATFKNSLVYRTSLSNIYLKRKADGALTDAIPFTETFLIDKTEPIVVCNATDQYGNAVIIDDGAEVHAKTISFDVTDDNLVSVIADGKVFSVENGVATVTLEADDGISKTVNMVAEDIAGNTTNISFTIEYIKTVSTATVSVSDIFLGLEFKPVLTTNSDGEATYYYKRVGSSDDTYTTVKPDSVGKYYVQARIPATEDFTAVTAEDIFEIKFLPAPQVTFTVSGIEGNNDFYKSDVELVAPEGFTISDKADGVFAKSIIYKEGLDKIFLMRADGALTAAIDFNETYKIDKVLPETSKVGTLTDKKKQVTKNVSIKNGMSIYADTLDFSMFDENLLTITVNGETVEFNEKTAKILLDANNRTSKFSIVAEDKAGNTTSLSIVLKAAWLENNIIPAGASITLEAGQVYNLEEGLWTVSGDSTVYYGGNSFCVDGTKDCVFTEQN